MRIEGPKRFLFLLLQKACAERGPTEKQEAESINSEGPRDQAPRQGRLQSSSALFLEHLLQSDNCWGLRAIGFALPSSIKAQPIKSGDA